MTQFSLFDAVDEAPRFLPACPHNGTETSRAGAEHAAATGQVQAQEKAILRALAQVEWLKPGHGATRKEITNFLHGSNLSIPSIPESRVGARVNRLIANGLCREEGTRVPAGGTVRQKVVFVTEAGLAAIREAMEAGK